MLLNNEIFLLGGYMIKVMIKSNATFTLCYQWPQQLRLPETYCAMYFGHFCLQVLLGCTKFPYSLSWYPWQAVGVKKQLL